MKYVPGSKLIIFFLNFWCWILLFQNKREIDMVQPYSTKIVWWFSGGTTSKCVCLSLSLSVCHHGHHKVSYLNRQVAGVRSLKTAKPLEIFAKTVIPLDTLDENEKVSKEFALNHIKAQLHNDKKWRIVWNLGYEKTQLNFCKVKKPHWNFC